MFREMLRKKQQLSQDECAELLRREMRGVLSVQGDDGYPYGLPMDHWYCEENGKLYFHSASGGHKIDAVKQYPKASFCVIDQDKIVPEKYTTHYRSVIAFGKVRLLEVQEEMRKIATALAMKYSSDYAEGIPAEIDDYMSRLAIIEMTIEHMTGKQPMGL